MVYPELHVGLVFGLGYGLGNALHSGLTGGAIATQVWPNASLQLPVRYASISGLGIGLGVGLSVGLGVGLVYGLSFGLSFGLLFGLLFGLGGWLRCGGRACLYHLALRLVLWYNNFAPFNYIRFLDEATAHRFLRKVGGGYIFVHRMLLEYFATMPQRGRGTGVL